VTNVEHIIDQRGRLVVGSGWIWKQYQDFALGLAGIFWVMIAMKVVVAFIKDWRASAAALCGQLALVSAIVAGLWAAHLSDKWSLLP
jgi:hypothetical protein